MLSPRPLLSIVGVAWVQEYALTIIVVKCEVRVRKITGKVNKFQTLGQKKYYWSNSQFVTLKCFIRVAPLANCQQLESNPYSRTHFHDIPDIRMTRNMVE